LTGTDSEDAEEYLADTPPAEPEPTAMPSTGGEETQSGAAPADGEVAEGDSTANVWIFSSVAALLLAGLGFGLARRRKL
jgi:MYXO-CTERM domain-containing protein